MATKTAVKKTVKKKKSKVHDGISFTSVEQVPVGDLKGHDKNPRQGNVDIVADSLSTFGQFRPIIVNSRNNTIIAGHHTWLAARKLGWDTISVAWMDVDDDTHKRIMLMDNRSSDLGTYDDTILAELFASLPDYSGTGYNPAEVQDIVDQVQREAAKASLGLDDYLKNMPAPDPNAAQPTGQPLDVRRRVMQNESDDQKEAAANRGADRQDFDGDKDIQAPELEDFEDIQAELQGVLEARELELWRGDNFYEIPDLRADMLVDRLPDGLRTWAGKDATPDDGTSWFLWNYGLGGVKGLPLDRTVLSFYTHDAKFSNWWALPAYYTSKVLAAGTRMAICPDFSFYYTQPRFVHLRGVYESQWLGRFFQEAGIKVIPRIQFSDPASLQFNMLGIPKNPPVVATSVQNLSRTKEQDGLGGLTKAEDFELNRSVLQKCIDTLEPTTQVLVYGGNPARRMLEALDLHGAEGVWIENYAAVRRGTVFDKKDGLAKASPAQRKKIREKAKAEEKQRRGITDDLMEDIDEDSDD